MEGIRYKTAHFTNILPAIPEIECYTPVLLFVTFSKIFRTNFRAREGKTDAISSQLKTK